MSDLSIGQKAPSFSLPATGNKTVSLSQFMHAPLVLYFYPKDDTSGCTAEACDFTAAIKQFETLNVSVLGVSKDNLNSHEKFKTKYNLAFDLASDETGETCQNYGVWVEKSMYGKKYMGIERSTFLINPNGTIKTIWRKVKVPGHVDAVLKALADA